MSKHTPGPWRVNQYTETTGANDGYLKGFPSISVLAKGEELIYVIGNGAGESLGDARLIAAAPELLQALRGLVRVALDRGFGDAELAQAERAIERAEMGGK